MIITRMRVTIVFPMHASLPMHKQNMLEFYYKIKCMKFSHTLHCSVRPSQTSSNLPNVPITQLWSDIRHNFVTIVVLKFQKMQLALICSRVACVPSTHRTSLPPTTRNPTLLGICRASDSPQEGSPAPKEDAPILMTEDEDATSVRDILKRRQERRSRRDRVQPESTDFVASALTRRFGLAGGLAWLAVLTAGVVGEQIKTRLELASEEAATTVVGDDAPEVVTPEGLRMKDSKIGGGQYPQKRDLIILHYKGFANGELFEDTYARKKPIVSIFGSRPFAGGLCRGAEIALSTMRAGGKRTVIIPPELGFVDGAVLRPTEHVPGKNGRIPPGATLTYELELVRVSIPPS